MGFFSSLFGSSKGEDNIDEQQKALLRNFDILKHDGMRALNMRQTAYAVKCFTEALKIKDDFESLKHLAAAMMMQGDFEKALNTLNRMLEHEEERIITLITRANILHLLNRFREAIADCNAIIAMDPESHAAFYLLAQSENGVGNREMSIEHLTQAIALKDDFADAYRLRSEVYLTMEQYENALADAGQVVELNAEDETAYILRGKIYEQLHNTGAALGDYRYALEMNPFNEDACLFAVKLLMNSANVDEAIALLNEAIEHNELFARAYQLRSLARGAKGDTAGAQKDLEIYGELVSTDAESEYKEEQAADLYKGNII
ncbi:MAG: tetratricopeptide repeat protein [Cytophagaceae bacterium]|jgi:tetratricopeptide (TPR) repeat protein|nr:tetratricopeptide repeat protein [Cytophagaceae bacterium]